MNTEEHSDDFVIGSIHVSPQHNTMTQNNHTCRLQPKAMAVLHYLAKNNDRVINNDELLEEVWEGRVVTHNSIQKSVNALRSAFKEFDDNFDYIVYFSKRGYQLVTPSVEESNNAKSAHNNKKYVFMLISVLLISIVLVYLFFTFYQKSTEVIAIQSFTQVKPFVSNTGREKIIEPHHSSERVAFVRDEATPENTTTTKSHLFIKALNGKEWSVSVARGNFINVAWSPSGRNLVAIDKHYKSLDSASIHEQQDLTYHYTLHIYTLDFKAEKIIEKNLLSHWVGYISSISWWDEDTLEFAAVQGNLLASRYRYDIAEQNLSMLKAPAEQGDLLMLHTFNQQTAILSLLENKEQIHFLDKRQKVLAKWPLPFKVKSMNWISNEKGLLLLSTKNQLSTLLINGQLHTIDYSPKVTGEINLARSKNNGKNIILTVQAPTIKNKTLARNLKSNVAPENKAESMPEHFMEKGGGFIYSLPQSGDLSL